MWNTATSLGLVGVSLREVENMRIACNRCLTEEVREAQKIISGLVQRVICLERLLIKEEQHTLNLETPKTSQKKQTFCGVEESKVNGDKYDEGM
jgi:hypothetical protein